jgi:hypothetical protein
VPYSLSFCQSIFYNYPFLHKYCSLYLECLTLKKEAILSFEISRATYQNTQRYTPQTLSPQLHRCENFESHINSVTARPTSPKSKRILFFIFSSSNFPQFPDSYFHQATSYLISFLAGTAFSKISLSYLCLISWSNIIEFPSDIFGAVFFIII